MPDGFILFSLVRWVVPEVVHCSGGCFGIVAGFQDCGILCIFPGAFYFGTLGIITGFPVGAIAGAIGWLPTYLFRESSAASYAAAILLGAVVGIYACFFDANSSDAVGGFSVANLASFLASAVSGGLASNAITRRWITYSAPREER